MKKLLFVAPILSIVLIFAGCTGTDIPDTTPGTAETDTQSQTTQSENPQAQADIEPEQLISKEEAKELIGEEVKNGEKSEMETVGKKLVLYDPVEASFAFLQIDLTQQSSMPKGSTITPEELYGAAKTALEETSSVEITGIGDDCFTGTPGLHILAKGYYIVIGAGNTNDPDVQRILKEAGETAVGNLYKILG